MYAVIDVKVNPPEIIDVFPQKEKKVAEQAAKDFRGSVVTFIRNDEVIENQWK